jgi:hypothetical protein
MPPTGLQQADPQSPDFALLDDRHGFTPEWGGQSRGVMPK